MEQIIAEVTSTATIAVALFGIAVCLIQTAHSYVRRCFAMFLAAVAINNMPDAFGRVFGTVDTAAVKLADQLVWNPSSFCLAPLFWLYVHAVTSPTGQPPARVYRHFVLAGLAMLIGLLIAVTPNSVAELLDSNGTMGVTAWSLTLLIAMVVVQLAVLPQVGVYLYRIVRRLMRHRIMLRDVYSSTEAHELRWIYVIGGLGALFWLATMLIQFLAFDPEPSNAMTFTFSIASLCGLALIATTTLWGLRQRPPLVPEPQDGPPPEDSKAKPPAQPHEKYEKSALSSEASARIARKLRAAMERDHLHRDPNLSLWALARHIGASPNYISQTLSEVIGESFFDFVNGYRIKEAKELLANSDGTVLAITYEVGFNARSSFYNAFKRLTGQTPTSYRKTLSNPVGLDDTHG